MAEQERDTLIAIGGAVKAMGGGRIRVTLAPYTDPTDADFDDEFFDGKTDFDRDFPCKMSLYYHHGADPALGAKRLGKVEVHEDAAVGLWFDHQLNMSDAYQAKVYELAKQGRLGGSSGAVAHLVRKSPAGKATHIDLWPLGEASLTVAPCHPSARAVAVKSLADLEAPPALEELASSTDDLPPSLAEDLDRVADHAERVTARCAGIKAGNAQFSQSRRERIARLRDELSALLEETLPGQRRETTTDTTPPPGPGEGAAGNPGAATLEKASAAGLNGSLPIPLPDVGDLYAALIRQEDRGLTPLGRL